MFNPGVAASGILIGNADEDLRASAVAVSAEPGGPRVAEAVRPQAAGIIEGLWRLGFL